MKTKGGVLIVMLTAYWLILQVCGNLQISLLIVSGLSVGLLSQFLYQKLWVELRLDIQKQVDDFKYTQRLNDFYIWHYQFENWVREFYNRQMILSYSDKMTKLVEQIKKNQKFEVVRNDGPEDEAA